MKDAEQLMLNTDPPCLVCGDPAALLCDALLGFRGHFYEEIKPELIGQYGPKRALWLIGPEWDGVTCDAPICERCTTKIGPVFDFPEPGVNFEDRCPVHRTVGALSIAQKMPFRPLRDEDLERIRMETHAEIRRAGFKMWKSALRERTDSDLIEGL